MSALFKNVVLPASILAGIIIGAGVFSLPFIFAQAGLAWGVVLLFFVTLLVYMLYVMYADIVVRTPGDHRFIGYAKIYLGEKSFWLTILMAVVEMIFVLTIYIILGISFVQLFTALSAEAALLVFWGVGSAFIFLNIRRMAAAEFLINAGIISIIALIFFYGFPSFNSTNHAQFDVSKLLLPLGPILFALAGRPAIPEMRSYFIEEKIPLSYMKPAILVGTFLPAAVYVFFVVGMFGLAGNGVAEDAISSLVGNVSYPFLASIGALGLLSLWSSYIVIGLNVKKILALDLGVHRFLSGIAVVGLPALLYVSGFTGFIMLVSFVGGLFLSLEGILIVLMWLKMNRISVSPPIFVKRARFGTIVVILAVLVTVFLNEILKLFT